MAEGMITLEEAQQISKKAIEKAKEMGGRVAIAILDEFGFPVLIERMDGVGIMTTDIAKAKAFTVILFRGQPTQQLAERFKNNPALITATSAIAPIMPFPGGMPITKNGSLIGAIGVSGGSVAEGHDQKCAEAAVANL
jgi:uncharacterized protein GlcG (DUF336 family)